MKLCLINKFLYFYCGVDGDEGDDDDNDDDDDRRRKTNFICLSQFFLLNQFNEYDDHNFVASISKN